MKELVHKGHSVTIAVTIPMHVRITTEASLDLKNAEGFAKNSLNAIPML